MKQKMKEQKKNTNFMFGVRISIVESMVYASIAVALGSCEKGYIPSMRASAV